MVPGCLNTQGSLCSNKDSLCPAPAIKEKECNGRSQNRAIHLLLLSWVHSWLTVGGHRTRLRGESQRAHLWRQMSPCHTALHLCIFPSLAGTLPCPSAVTLSVCFDICFSFFLSLYFDPSSHSHHVRLSVVQISYFHWRSFYTLYLPQQPSKCYPHGLVCFVSTSFHLYFSATFFKQSSFCLSWTLKAGSFS